MTFLFLNILIFHVLFGLLGVAFFIVVLISLSQANLNFKFLKRISLFGFLSFLISWVLGGYYYLYNYGGSVKPGIKAGDYSWAHSIIMETKEHLFLFIPILSFVVFLSFVFAQDDLNENKKLKKALLSLVFLIVLFGVLIAVSGALISGAV